jgi:hypothetical protein
MVAIVFSVLDELVEETSVCIVQLRREPVKVKVNEACSLNWSIALY